MVSTFAPTKNCELLEEENAWGKVQHGSVIERVAVQRQDAGIVCPPVSAQAGAGRCP